ncbi:hypothetical protein Amet_0284 [Alkaliphilus metalliredigens QYMF]|uniref:Protein GrpE n=1 Tax=Alkaliphilus metalliredigens (strain QYMF) TaxID=293826 RepID=A6TJZ8_ALKMQ|nr:nucleotide exchange factor GrpE [Alkaliphilus metalliredigens]ABR46516.1 hypothetical protein Amet_0284 [Alkaliphilus metalliredigens QYMF]
MIDVRKEIEKYEPIDLAQEEELQQDEFIEVLQHLQKSLNRFGKDQYKTLGQVEEVLELLEASEEKDKVYGDLRKEAKKKDEEIDALLLAIIMVTDALEDLYYYTVKNNEGSWAEQLSLLWEKLGQKLSYYGIVRIGEEGTTFSSHHGIAEGISKDANRSHGEIVEVIQLGYVYRGRVLRKARVIVNENEERVKYE